MSSRKISRADDLTQRRPKLTRGVCSRRWGMDRRVSMDCWKSPTRVSRHSRLPKSSGELTAAAMTGPVTAWAML